MAHLVIVGHGPKQNGTFDPGASGFIKKGEHRYMVEDLIPAMRKILPKDHNVVFFNVYNVYDRGNIVALSKQYKAKQVTELHFDASGNKNATGGHVIIHSDYGPDKMDLALRDAINSMVGLSNYSHKGHKGVSGRANLANVNRMRGSGIAYRLLELGFGTNKKDAEIMTDDVDAYAKRLVQAIAGEVKEDKSKPAVAPKQEQADRYTVKGGDTLTSIAARFNTTVEALIKLNNIGRPNFIHVGDSLVIKNEPSNPTGDYTVNKDTVGYKTSLDAKNKRNRATTVKKGTYHVFNKASGMINVTSKKGVPGSWINPDDGGPVVITSSDNKTLKVGQQVMIKQSATRYATGETIPGLYKGNEYTIQQIGSDRVLLEEIYSWVLKKDVQ